MRVRSSVRWLGLSISFALLACGSSADVSDNSGDDGGTDTSSAGDSRVTTDSRSDTTTSGDSAKDGASDTKTSDTSSSDTATSDTTTVADTTSTDTTASDTTTIVDSVSIDTTTGDTATGDTVSIDVTPTDSIVTDGSCAGVECAGFPATFVTGCTVDDNCVGEMHQVDCCGAMRVLGMNHGEASVFCTAEFGAGAGSGCRSEYPSPAGCSSDVITADDGLTTTDPTKVAVHCLPTSTTGGTCETFVCGTAGGTPCPTFRRIGTCGP